MATQKTAGKKTTVAEYLSGVMGLTDKTQKTIASELGYENPNVISLIKQGRTKLPVNKVQLMAQSLGIDPVNLLRLVMTEYMPETWTVIASVMGDKLISEDERKLVGLARDASGDAGFYLQDPKLVADLKTAFGAHADRAKAERKMGAASVKPGRPANS
jgi:transcriptional regulator with XRE-family HTH domain